MTSYARRGAVEFDILCGWALWIVPGCSTGMLLADHVDAHLLTLIFAIGVALMFINFPVPHLGNKVVADVMPGGPVRIAFATGLGRHGLPWGPLGYVNLPATAAVAAMSILTAPLNVAAVHSLLARPVKLVFGLDLLFMAPVMFSRSM